MLKISDTSIAETIQELQKYNLNASFLVPTKIGLEKSILDATYQVRNYLKDHGFHDYDIQSQGNENKVIKNYYLVDEHNCIQNNVSLYRPNTKSGDPRLWFYKLSQFCKHGNLLALVVIDEELYVINCSNNFLSEKLQNNQEFLSKLSETSTDEVFEELLDKMIEIHRHGYYKSVGKGHKSIGETLEHILGINPNSSKNPDYKGIELKATRSKKNRSNLFSCVPNWKNSRLKSTKDILNERGLYNKADDRVALYHTLAVNKPNSYNMVLRMQNDSQLDQNYIHNDSSEEHDVNWDIEELKKRLVNKHPKSFWVKADAQIHGDSEHFRYDEIIFTQSPNTNYFVNLLEEGIITIDFAMHFRKNGAARDHGYLFKILPDKLNLLFPSPKKINLKELI